jgi:hypothetical protein
MAEDFVPEEETPEGTQQEQDPEKLLRALRAEREKRKAAEARLKDVQQEADAFVDAKSRFPWLKKDHLKGRPVEEWDGWLSELNELRGGATTQEGTSTEPTQPVTRPEEATFAKAAQVSAGTVGTGGQPVAWNELRKLPMAQQMDLIREGLALDIDGQPIKA